MELVRDSNGLCIPVKVGELGMIMGKVRNDVLSRFEGRLNKMDGHLRKWTVKYFHVERFMNKLQDPPRSMINDLPPNERPVWLMTVQFDYRPSTLNQIQKP